MITIRTATTKDLEKLRDFEQGVIHAERPYDPTLQKGQIRYYDLEQMITSDQIQLAVAVKDDQIIASGYARLEKAKHYLDHKIYAYLGFMFTHPDHRGQRVNSLIMDHLSKWALSKNVTELRLEVYEENNIAIRAYEKAGFKKILVTMRKRAE